MKILKSRILLVIVTIILTGSISVYAARKYYASDIEYKETTLDKALDTLYTTQNTTVNNLNSQITSLTNEKTSLQNQINTKDATISSLQSQLSVYDNANCVTGSFDSSNYSTSTDKKLINFSPKKFIIYETTSAWGGGHFWLEGWTNFVDITWGKDYINTSQSLSKYYTVNNGLYIHNFPSGVTLYYMACR